MSGYKPKTTTYCNPVHNSGNKDSGNNTFAALHTIAEIMKLRKLFLR